MLLADRLSLAFAATPGLTQSGLASACGITRSSVNAWIHGKTDSIDGKYLTKAAAYLNVSAHWLSTGEGEMVPTITTANVKWDMGQPVAALGADDGHDDDYIQIRESEVRFAAGNGRTAHYDELAESVPATYRLEWFNKEGINPANARRFKVDGHSMEPFLFDSDTVLVNLGEISVTNGKVYALRYGDELRIKRVYRRLDGGLILHSDNPDHLPRDEDISPAMAQEHITIIGRVRDKSGTGGL
jgi:phage repressor protein C with HTH and peptisase S24 domain